eukprot:11685596-Alexandrium_andersonii.AAC.1
MELVQNSPTHKVGVSVSGLDRHYYGLAPDLACAALASCCLLWTFAHGAGRASDHLPLRAVCGWGS